MHCVGRRNAVSRLVRSRAARRAAYSKRRRACACPMMMTTTSSCRTSSASPSAGKTPLGWAIFSFRRFFWWLGKVISRRIILLPCYHLAVGAVTILFDDRFGTVVRRLAYYARGRGFGPCTVQTFGCINMSVCIACFYICMYLQKKVYNYVCLYDT
jgi:hypothetical protein